MVPVPRDLVAEVERFLVWNVGREPAAWDRTAAAEFLAGLEPEGRALLLLAAEAAVEERPLTCAEAARVLGLSPREIVGLGIELNEQVGRAGGPMFLLATSLRDIGPDGTRPPRRVDMTSGVAVVLLDATGRGTPDRAEAPERVEVEDPSL